MKSIHLSQYFERFKEKIGYKRWRGLKYLLIAIPFLVYIILFNYIPLFGWGLAFTDYRMGLSFDKIQFVGLKYFISIFTDTQLPRVLRNTLVMCGFDLLISPIAPCMAIFMNEIRNAKTKKLVQTITTFPKFISGVVVFGLAQSIFSVHGLFNQLLDAIGLPTFMFGLIGDPNLVWPFQSFLGVWQWTGWNTILYLAAIAGIDQELYDAAKVDGANRMQQIRYITVPALLPTYFTTRFLALGNLLEGGLDAGLLYGNTMTLDKLEYLDYYVYKTGLRLGRYSYSTATSIVQSLVGLALMFSVNYITKKIRGTSVI